MSEFDWDTDLCNFSAIFILMAKLLLVEDDIELAEKVKIWLEFEKFNVDVANNGADARNFLSAYSYDAIMFDWELPDTTGVTLCQELRAKGGMMPVLMLTGKSAIDDKEVGFESGADDYLTKPFNLKELSARMRALLRRAPVIQNKVIECKNLTLEVGAFRVTNDGVAIQLSPKEYRLLEYFLQHPNQVFSSKALLDAVWESDSFVSEDTIRTYVKTLRRKVTSKTGECPIKTIHSLGYTVEMP
jgi:DNA-binding response OmpR family regulator